MQPELTVRQLVDAEGGMGQGPMAGVEGKRARVGETMPYEDAVAPNDDAVPRNGGYQLADRLDSTGTATLREIPATAGPAPDLGRQAEENQVSKLDGAGRDFDQSIEPEG
jgi:hypothetical protein